MSSSPVDLRVDWCSYQAAKYAVEHWHYSRTMPVSKRVYIGAWENRVFIGAIVFALGATPTLGSKYNLTMWECCELVRVALNAHASPVSQIVTKAIKLLKSQSDGLRLIVSFADPFHGHNGSIYQAMNWIYTGQTTTVDTWTVNGKLIHRRAYTGVNYGAPKQKLPQNAKRVTVPAKHRYLYPLDRAMRKQIAPLAQPYPKRDTRPVNGDTLATSEAGRFNSEPGALIEAEPHGD